MKHLWAPWRTKYINMHSTMKGCFLCTEPGAGNDKRNNILYRGKKTFVIMNRYPYNNGHLMVVPYRHTGDFSKLTQEELCELMELTKQTFIILNKVLKPHGYNAGFNLGRVSGAGLENHIHMHIVPRWNGDTNFMPVLGKSKVISQSLDTLYAILIKHFTLLRKANKKKELI